MIKRCVLVNFIDIITTEERHGKLFRSLNYTIVNSQLPSFEFIDSKNNWMIMPWNGRNIAHSIEVSNYLIHYFIHMDIYPKIETIYLPRFHNRVYEWEKEYMKSIRSLFDENHAMKFVNFEEMKNLTPKNQGIICFREIGFSSRLENLGMEGCL